MNELDSNGSPLGHPGSAANYVASAVRVYNGNSNLKSAGVPMNFEPWQVEEWVRCAEDPIYFIENYIKVVTIDNGLQPMKLYDFQKKMVKGILVDSNRMICATCRQAGKSTTMAAVFTHYVIFNQMKTCAILANKAATAREILARTQLAYEHLPKWLQQGVLEWNKGSFLLENGSRVLASSTSSSAVRGYSVNLLFLDEFGHIPPNIAEDFFTSVYPTISSGKTSKLAIVSTPNGMNLFYKFWTEALAGTNGFLPIKATWRDVPGRDQKWADDQKAVLGEAKFLQELEVEFHGSSATLINGQKLVTIPVSTPVKHTDTLKIYDTPAVGRAYVMCVDTARGTGGDYSAVVVVDVTELPYSISAVYRDNKINTMLFPGLVFKLGMEYNEAAALIETNDMGEQIANALFYDYEYEQVVMSNGANLSSFGGKTPGMKTTKRTKSLGCDALKTLVEGDKLVLRDAEILYELANFVVKGASYAADTGNDDLAMCLVLFAYLSTQPAMQDLTSVSAREQILIEKMKAAEEEMMPVGFFNDGTEAEIDHFRF